MTRKKIAFDVHESKVVPGPTGRATTTRLRLDPAEAAALGEVIDYLSGLRRTDLAARCRIPLPERFEKDSPEAEAQKTARNKAQADRKRALSDASTSRWAGSIMRGNDAQYELARRCQKDDIRDKKAAIKKLTQRISLPSWDVMTDPQKADFEQAKKPGKRPVSGYKTQAERAMKQRRLDQLRSQVATLEADYAAGTVHVVDGGARLLHQRHHLDAAGVTQAQWRRVWDAKRAWIRANGSSDEAYGNSTVTLTPDGTLSIALPAALAHLANAPRNRNRFQVTAPVVFNHLGAEWLAQATGATTGPRVTATGRKVAYGAVSYTLAVKPTKNPRKTGIYLTASWTQEPYAVPDDGGRVLGIDLNAGHLDGWVLDPSGNPVGAPITVPYDTAGTTNQRDASVQLALGQIIDMALESGVGTIVVEDLGFDDARVTGRETMGRGTRGKTFRRTVSGLPTGKVRNWLTSKTYRAGVRLVAVNPAYTSKWAKEHWLKPLRARSGKNVTGHQAAGLVIGRRGIGIKARRRKGVTGQVQRNHARRATDRNAGPNADAPCGTPLRRPPSRLESARTTRQQPTKARATVTPGVGNTTTPRRSCQHKI